MSKKYHQTNVEFTPLEKIEQLYTELVHWYGHADEKELRVAAKLLLVSLDKFSLYGGANWPQLVSEYVDILQHNPDKFERILEANRGELKDKNPNSLPH